MGDDGKIEVDMVEKISSGSAPNATANANADHALIAAVNQSLDKSLADIDEMSLQRLKNARITALSSSQKSRKWVPLSVAASLAALLLIPVVMQHKSATISVEPEFEMVSQEQPISSEEMDDIDMLMALEDTDA